MVNGLRKWFGMLMNQFSLIYIDIHLSRLFFLNVMWQVIDKLHEYQQACSDMLDCKLKMFEVQGNALDPKLLQKMAFYCKQGIKANSIIIGEFPDRHCG